MIFWFLFCSIFFDRISSSVWSKSVRFDSGGPLAWIFFFILGWLFGPNRFGFQTKTKLGHHKLVWFGSIQFFLSIFWPDGSVFGWPSEFRFGSIRFRAKIDPNRAIFCPSSHCLTNEMLGWAMRKYFWVNKNALLWIDLFTLSFQINFQRKRLPTFERKKANLFECSSYSRVVWRISSTIWPTSSAIMLASSVAFSTISGVFPTSLTTSSVGLSGFRWVCYCVQKHKALVS